MHSGDAAPGSADLRRLTGDRDKAVAYAEDLYFRECWPDAQQMFGSSFWPIVEESALLMAKPDSVVGRRLTRILEYAESAGFALLLAAPLALDRHSVRALWRNDWTAYSADRLSLATLFYTAADAMMFIFRDVAPERGVPACSRLCRLKGSAFPELRKADDLRTVLKPSNRVLNFVHVADEPIDLIRELGIFFDHAQRTAILADWRARFDSARSTDGQLEIAQIEARFLPHDLDFASSVRRLEHAQMISARDADALGKLKSSGEKIKWDALAGLLRLAIQEPGHLWDCVVVGSELIELERAGRVIDS